MEEVDKQAKLKELEASLAEELDETVVVVSEGGNVTKNDVMVNPSMVTRGDPNNGKNSSGQSVTGGVDDAPSSIHVGGSPSDSNAATGTADISLDSLDSILNREDPGFAASMDEVRAGLVDADVQIQAGDDLLAASDNGEDEPETRFRRLFSKLKYRLGEFKRRWSENFVENSKMAALKMWGLIVFTSKSVFVVIKQMTGRQWMLLLAYICVVATMGYWNQNAQRLLSHFEGARFVGDLSTVADAHFQVGEHEDYRLFNDPLDEFEFIVQYRRMIVNLKPSKSSTRNPMMTFLIYLVGSNRETAIELKDRESQVRDISQRVAENMNYDEMVSAEGKKKFKLLVRKEVNKVLNHGRLRAIYFDTIILKQ